MNNPLCSRLPAATLLIALLLLLLGSLPAFGQEQIVIESADRAEGGVVGGEPVRKLIGNVRLLSDQLVMEADSAWQFQERELLQAFNVQITAENEIIWADTILHDTAEEISRFRGRVIIHSERNTLFSESVDYDRRLDMARFNSPVRFEDDRGVLFARDGYYLQSTDIAFFRGDVQLADSTQYLEADSLFMSRESDYYRLFDRVYAEDFTERITLAGDYLEADSSGHRMLIGDVWMMQVSDSETDTTHLVSRSLRLLETGEGDFMDAWGDVRIWASSYAARADTVHYRSDLEQFRLLSEPIVWQERIQLTGPYMEVWMEEEQISRLESWTRPIAVMQDSATGRFNQMRGDTLRAFFEEGEIARIVVFDNSELIFHLKNEEDEPDGLIELIAGGAATITFSGGDLDTFHAGRNIQGSHLREDPSTSGRQLSGFRWDPDMRPVRPSIRTRRLPDIPPDRPFILPERYLRYMRSTGNDPVLTAPR